jgi:thiol-disulfide isomerase/thioredoxin
MTGQQKTGGMILAMLAACWALTPPSLAGQSGPPRLANGPAPVPLKGVALTAADAVGLAKAIKAAHGNVVMINFWATWCGPCVAEFPDVVSIYNSYHDRGLTLLTVSGDEPNDKTKAGLFLKRQHAPETAFIKPKGDLAAWSKSLDARWDSGSLPRTYLIDRSGKVRKVIDGKINAADLKKTLATLLAEKPGPAAPPTAKGKGPLAE